VVNATHLTVGFCFVCFEKLEGTIGADREVSLFAVKMGICCSKGTQPSLIDRDEVPMLNQETKVEIEELVRQNRDLRPRAPLLDVMQTTFKSAADIDSSASPIDEQLIDQLASSDSDNAHPDSPSRS
jgi:hypothetical protein